MPRKLQTAKLSKTETDEVSQDTISAQAPHRKVDFSTLKPVPRAINTEGVSPNKEHTTMSNQPFSFDMDFSTIKGFEPLPDGRYNASIVEAKPGTSQNNNPTLTLKWRVTDGEHEGRVIYDVLTFTKDAEWRVKAVCEGLAPFQPDPETGAPWTGRITPELFIGEPAVITVALDTKSTGKIDPKTGKPYEARPRVQSVALAGSLADFDDIVASVDD